MFKLNLAVAIVFAMAATAHAQPSLSPGPAPAAAAAPIGAPPSDALPASSLTLADALAVAARNNPALRGARADVDASAGALMQAGARPNPEVSFLQEGFSRAERTSTALINQTIELGGKRRARLDVASYGRESASASLDEQGAVVRADVIAAFYGLLAAQRQLQVTEESAAIAARSADLAARRAQAGKVSPVEATKAQVAAAGVQIEVVTARGRVDVAREKLNAVMGEARNDPLAVLGDLEAVPSVEPLSALTARLDDAPLARIARAEMLRSNAAVSLERARRIPDVTVSAGVKRVTTGGVPDNQAVVGVSIPIPLFNTNKGALLEATHKAERANADLDRERTRLRLELTQAYANFEAAEQEAQRLKSDILPAARVALDAMSRGYELGKFSFLDVLDAQRTLFQGQSQYVRALADAHTARADIGRLVGTPLAAGAQ
ncbi:MULTISPECIES: TolC family protein [Burkholderia]|jgi:outer membrane protein, heavy metal efflux system|uniref:TolC family protein n=9 Tax=Burkholderia cepacia complex TaxID=87882 RepID=A0AAP4RAJ1_9BURK|nr:MULTISPECIES: TolC family protein [Burkholderia]EKS9800355.1 TolC family protein [Burkholderia cepacia]EKS9807840.1 TolC family protein [Burkholderia cepacia]EKS9815440.1 TolC family protein [Burkholderia cepacia]EKS9821965.1 TolC family protein [Burkholderia cepacia]EKS9829590.1 TolC family protein [Burkholderia cepacia]